MKASTTLTMAVFAPMALAARFHERRTHPEPAMPAMEHPVAEPAPAPPAEHPVVEAPAEVVHPGVTKEHKTEIIIIWQNPGAGAETTTVAEKVTVTETVTKGGEVATQPAAAASHTVTVGGPGGLVYQPEELHDIPIGDTIIFEFLSQNHTVSQSGFATPCDLMEGGMDSGFMANPNNTVVPPPQIALQVMAEAPLWFYCKAATHCGKGMTFSINPTAEKTQAQFQALAIAQNGTGEASPITGGVTAPPPPAAGAPAAPAPPAAAPPALAPGQGVVQPDGSCSCMASCTFDAGFPAVGAQGVGASGGYGGSLPVNMAGLR
jgi:hypothetical protein